MPRGACVLALLATTALSTVGLARAKGDSPLFEAAKRRDFAAVRLLIEQGTPVDQPYGDGSTALHWAAHEDDVETAEFLLGAKAQVNLANEYGVTPLWLACENGSTKMIDTLLKAGANPNLRQPSTGVTPLMLAARQGNPKAVMTLLEHGGDSSIGERQFGQVALMWAAAKNHAEVVRMLIDDGADVQARSKNGFTAFLFAAREGAIDAGKVLLGAGALPSDAAVDGSRPLLVATVRAHTEFALLLLERGVDPNAIDAGYTALHWAAGLWESEVPGQFGRNERLVKSLLTHGADPNIRMRKEPPRLGYVAASRMRLPLAGATPFFLAALAGDVGIMRALVDAGADPLLPTNDDSTPLMAAAGLGRPLETKVTESHAIEAVTLALQLGNNVNAVNRSEMHTALHSAAMMGLNNVVRFLIQNGATLNAKNKLGMTPLDMAEGRYRAGFSSEISSPSTAEVLRQAGGKRGSL